MKCVSLFSGAGGLDLGLEAAGFEIVAAVEQDTDCCRTLELNGRVGVIKSSVGDVDLESIAASGPIDLLAGGPPCQPFSKSALWTRAGTLGLDDPRAGTIAQYLQALEILKPRAFLLENVEGFGRWGGLAALEEALGGLREKGHSYALATAVLNAADFGVPQKRRRLFAIGIRDGEPFRFPQPSHGDGGKPYATAWDACASAGAAREDEALQLKGRWADLLPSIPPGQNYLFHTPRGGGEPLFGWRTRFWSFLYKLDPHAPSPTIVANPSQNSGPFHWENRLLSTPELAALQTFPKRYAFHGARASRHRQIGNAVPPLLAERIGRALIAQLGGALPKRLRFAVMRARDNPAVAPATPVPERFRGQAGPHADHPGAGLGPRPRPRQPVTPPEEAAA